MQHVSEREVSERIQRFLDRKFAEHPELRYDGRVISRWRPKPMRRTHGDYILARL